MSGTLDDIDSLFEYARETVDEFVEHLTKEDEDIPSFVFFVTEAGELGFMPTDHILSSDEGVAFLSYIALPKIIVQVSASRYAMVNTGWRAEGDPETGELQKWKEENPDASLVEYPGGVTEEILLTCGDADGTLLSSSRQIVRKKGAPPDVLGWENELRTDWTDRGDEGENIRGRMVDAPMAALTGKRLMTDEMLQKVHARMVEERAVREAIARAMVKAGYDPDELMDLYEHEGPDSLAEPFQKISENMDEEGMRTMEAIFMEHMPDYGEEMFQREMQQSLEDLGKEMIRRTMEETN